MQTIHFIQSYYYYSHITCTAQHSAIQLTMGSGHPRRESQLDLELDLHSPRPSYAAKLLHSGGSIEDHYHHSRSAIVEVLNLMRRILYINSSAYEETFGMMSSRI